ncbi:hypothetical protein IDH44_02775 [Paenibacillus sp. IB182496]|uniref:Uncharacterized protein n=1 Tax=Paenibacillus sabuli TaxID=2772509 RepID=A0A927GQ81_9BACL|nr:hypothetical protein [Paenibacillus sabuli]MBD2844098.1 hypothetical protein [Paenibacillus sabuli]
MDASDREVDVADRAASSARDGAVSTDGAAGPGARDVRSVQRLTLPAGCDASWVGGEYMRWMSRLAPWLLRVERTDERVSRIYLRGSREPLLVMWLFKRHFQRLQTGSGVRRRQDPAH